jgi:CBS domain-containing protein
MLQLDFVTRRRLELHWRATRVMLRKLLTGSLRRGLSSVPEAFPISPTLTIGDVSPRLRHLPEAEMRARFEISSDSTVARAVKHLARERITFACVSDQSQDGRVIGMFSERDYLRYAMRAESSAFFSGMDATMEPVTRAMSAAERMLSVRNDTTVFTALSMVQHKIWRHLPILDEKERLTSILDIRDLLLELDGGRSDQHPVPGQHLRSVWHGKCVADILRTKRREKIVEGTSLELYLRTRAASHTIASSATIEGAAKQMARERLTFLVVIEEEGRQDTTRLYVPSPFERNRVVGLVNERDFVRFGAEHDDGLGAYASTPVRTARSAAAVAAFALLLSARLCSAPI